MEYVTLGSTAREVSRLGFGGATAGLRNYLREFDPDKPEDRKPVVAAIRRARELGVNYFDTAAGYGDGASERIFGEALQDEDPEDIFLASKAGVWKPEGVRASLEQSLENLRRDWIDLLQVHGTVYHDEHVEAVLRDGGMLDRMEKMREEGLIKHIGFTVEAQNKQLYQLLETGRFDVIQVCYNFIFQHPYDPSWQSGSLYDAEALGMGIVAMRSTTCGTFQKWVQAVNPENTHDYTPDLIQFEFSNPLVDVALVGMSSPERVEQNVALCEDKTGRVDLEDMHERYV